MAKLRVDKIASVGVSTETTGSVFFDGTGDYIKSSIDSEDFAFSGDFAMECWVQKAGNGAHADGVGNVIMMTGNASNNRNGIWISVTNAGSLLGKVAYDTSSWALEISGGTLSNDVWYHVALTRSGSTVRLFLDGAQQASGSDSTDITTTYSNAFSVGGQFNPAGSRHVNGYVSNARICKGHPVYTSNFTPPTRELDVHQGPDNDRTVVLACYDGENIFADKSGRHVIAAYGDRTSSPTPTATDSPIGITTFQPGLDRDVDNTFGPTFQGGAGYTSQNWLTLPKGTTTERYAGSNSANPAPRGLRGSGQTPSITDTIDFVEIATTGNAVDFGNLTQSKFGTGGIGSPTRGLFCGGGTPTRLTEIDYVTIATEGNAQDFGDITGSARTLAGATGGNATRGLTFGGALTSGTTNVICAITISSTGSATDFGDCTKQNGCAVVCSPTRAVSAGGDTNADGSNINTIDFVTIQSMGNSLDFGDLLSAASGRGVSSITRGLFSAESSASNRIQYVTIATTGNAVDFGDLITNNLIGCASYSSLTRGCFAGLRTPSLTDTIEYFTMATLGDALDFGNLTQTVNNGGGCSNGHGGLG